VFRAARLGRCLAAQAPTGIGKTVGIVFPLLKACPGAALDQVFFLSAKGSGRRLALDALDTIGAGTLPLRVLELTAREKACEHPDKACHGDACPLARGFYDRLPAARAAAVARATLTRDTLREVALAHDVCPYWLGQDLARWSDVVVGDYNHWFDASALLHGVATADERRVAVLVDEAHNLVERARAMYSAELSHDTLRTVRRAAPSSLKRPLDRLHRAWNAVAKAHPQAYQVVAEPPRAFVAALQDAAAAVGDWMAESPSTLDSDLLRFWFDALAFGRLLESFGSHSLFDVAVVPRGRAAACTVGIRNVVPAPFLAPRLAAARTTVLFSATLAPQRFYADTLGLPADTAWLDVEAPFDPSQLAVHVVRDVSTRWRHRARSVAPIVRIVARQYAAQPGNYLAFFSSFDYLQQVAAEFAARHPDVPVWQQSPRMDDTARDAFLARFHEGGRGIGFAVLGGTFAEGIDLPGRRLIGAFIATLGLPQVNALNEEMRQRIDTTFGAGYAYTYLYPGIRKVVQAAGRVIRTPTDRGSVFLIDDRYAARDVQDLLPRWWRVQTAVAGSPSRTTAVSASAGRASM
jgi:DNA excision repair protein ERCC-2